MQAALFALRMFIHIFAKDQSSSIWTRSQNAQRRKERERDMKMLHFLSLISSLKDLREYFKKHRNKRKSHSTDLDWIYSPKHKINLFILLHASYGQALSLPSSPGTVLYTHYLVYGLLVHTLSPFTPFWLEKCPVFCSKCFFRFGSAPIVLSCSTNHEKCLCLLSE